MARPVGSTNRRGAAAIKAVREKYPHYDPLVALAKLAHTSEDVDVQFSCHKELATYWYPKLKAIELTGENGEPVKHSVKVIFEASQTAVDAGRLDGD